MLARLDAPTHPYTASLLHVGEPGRARHEMRTAVMEILKGSACLGLPRHRYHYAAEAMCHELRVPLDREPDLHGKSVQRIDELLLDAGRSMNECLAVDVRWFMPLPESGDLPFVGWVERAAVPRRVEVAEQLVSILASLAERSADAKRTVEEDGEVLQDLLRVYGAASARDLDVVFFQH